MSVFCVCEWTGEGGEKGTHTHPPSPHTHSLSHTPMLCSITSKDIHHTLILLFRISFPVSALSRAHYSLTQSLAYSLHALSTHSFSTRSTHSTHSLTLTPTYALPCAQYWHSPHSYSSFSNFLYFLSFSNFLSCFLSPLRSPLLQSFEGL